MKTDKKHFLLFGILLAGFIVRMIYLYHFKDNAYFNPFLLDKHDQKTFILWAQQILRNPLGAPGDAFYMAPLYPYFLSGLYAIFSGNLIFIAIVQLLLDTVVCYLVYYLGSRIYDERAGIVAAFLACFYRTSIVYAATILSDALILFLYILFIALVYFALQKPGVERWTASGVVLGLAALAKPTIAVYLPFLFIGLHLYPEKDILPGKIRRNLQPAAVLGLLLLVSGLVILPVTIRNFFVSGKLVPICTNGPINWRIGNSSDSIGLFYYPKGEFLAPFSSAFWKLFLTKLHLFFTSYEWPQNLNVHLMEKAIPVLKAAFVKFGFIVPLGVAGLFALLADWKRNFILITFTLSNVLWVVLFFVTDRYRLPAVGCFSVCAGYFIVWTVEKLKEKKPAVPFSLWIFTGCFAFFFNATPGPLIPDASYALFSSISIRNIQNDFQQNDVEAAYRKAVTYYRLMPNDYQASFLLACTCYARGDRTTAVSLLNRTLQLNPGFEPARNMLRDLSP